LRVYGKSKERISTEKTRSAFRASPQIATPDFASSFGSASTATPNGGPCVTPSCLNLRDTHHNAISWKTRCSECQLTTSTVVSDLPRGARSVKVSSKVHDNETIETETSAAKRQKIDRTASKAVQKKTDQQRVENMARIMGNEPWGKGKKVAAKTKEVKKVASKKRKQFCEEESDQEIYQEESDGEQLDSDDE
jgi:hypothetical protein